MGYKMKGTAFYGKSPLKQKRTKKDETKHAHTIGDKKYKTSTFENRPNKKGDSQEEVLSKAHKNVKKQTGKLNKHYDDPRYGKSLSKKEYDDLTKKEKSATKDYNVATDRFAHVSDSLNVVNKNWPKIKKKK